MKQSDLGKSLDPSPEVCFYGSYVPEAYLTHWDSALIFHNILCLWWEQKITFDPVWTSVVQQTNVRLSTAQSTLMRQGVILLVTMMMNGNEKRIKNKKCMNGAQ